MLSLKYQTRNEFKILKHTASGETDKVDIGNQHYGSSTSAINESNHFEGNNDHNNSQWRKILRQKTTNPQTKTNSMKSTTNDKNNSWQIQR